MANEDRRIYTGSAMKKRQHLLIAASLSLDHRWRHPPDPKPEVAAEIAFSVFLSSSSSSSSDAVKYEFRQALLALVVTGVVLVSAATAGSLVVAGRVAGGSGIVADEVEVAGVAVAVTLVVVL